MQINSPSTILPRTHHHGCFEFSSISYAMNKLVPQVPMWHGFSSFSFFQIPLVPLPIKLFKNFLFSPLILKVLTMTRNIQDSSQSQQSKHSRVLFFHQLFTECPLFSGHCVGTMVPFPSLCYTLPYGPLSGTTWGILEMSLWNHFL